MHKEQVIHSFNGQNSTDEEKEKKWIETITILEEIGFAKNGNTLRKKF